MRSGDKVHPRRQPTPEPERRRQLDVVLPEEEIAYKVDPLGRCLDHEGIGPIIADQVVETRSLLKGVIPVVTEDRVIAAASRQRVREGVADQRFAAATTG
jgi:hypothetical protein